MKLKFKKTYRTLYNASFEVPAMLASIKSELTFLPQPKKRSLAPFRLAVQMVGLFMFVSFIITKERVGNLDLERYPLSGMDYLLIFLSFGLLLLTIIEIVIRVSKHFKNNKVKE